MNSNAEIYHEVAERCSAYDCKSYNSGNSFTNSMDDRKSCLNCRHFSNDEYCKLDMYDKVAQNL